MKTKISLAVQKFRNLLAVSGFMMIIATQDVLAWGSSGLENQIDTPNNSDLPSFIIKVVNYLLGFLALVAVLVIIAAGVMMIISAGGDNAKKAQKMILWAVIGLIVIALAWGIVHFVMTSLEG